MNLTRTPVLVVVCKWPNPLTVCLETGLNQVFSQSNSPIV